MRLFDDFFPSQVIAFVSNADEDFSLPADGFSLTPQQQMLLTNAVGFQVTRVLTPRQMHGEQVLVADRRFCRSPQLLMADAIITPVTEEVIGVRTADCLPVFFYDPAHEVIALAHAGWRSTKDGIAARTLSLMAKTYGTRVAEVRVGFGPCIRQKYYEVGGEFMAWFESHVVERDGHFYLDLAGANKDQLIKLGVDCEHIRDCGVDTYLDKTCHSYRRDQQEAGRMLSVMCMKGVNK